MHQHVVVDIPETGDELVVDDLTVGDLQVAAHFLGKSWQEIDPTDTVDLAALLLTVFAQDGPEKIEKLRGRRLAISRVEIRLTASLRDVPPDASAAGTLGTPEAPVPEVAA